MCTGDFFEIAVTKTLQKFLQFQGVCSIIIREIITKGVSELNKVNIGFIGAGNMGTAIMKGIVSCSMGESIELFAFDPDTKKVEELSGIGVTPCASESELTKNCKFVVLAVKPQVISGVLEKCAESADSDKVFVSIAAGITDEFVAQKTIPNAKVILVMPNTPLLLGEGASALSRNERVTDEEFEIILNVFRSCGKAEVIPKDKMKEIIAVNGSSPAFIYLFAKAFIDYAVSVGIDPKPATELFAQSLTGSAKMMTDSGYTIDELIKMVSSPGGTTLAGLDRLYKRDFEEIVKDCCDNCTKRAYELSQQ